MTSQFGRSQSRQPFEQSRTRTFPQQPRRYGKTEEAANESEVK
ncbi:hypothetical protein QA640_36350 [Bradyrhizobium sp. CB82]|nr:hypothetical protein [Bradyrhizobium sp. CB82]WFU39762.1 hypothetical protein QA640_36350 [Bradyrhizobium sp. CB82]